MNSSSGLNTLAIIPARGGSKGIPGKNLHPLCGKPLIEYSIRAALDSKIDRIVVSTDDEKIAAVARDLGAEVPFLRKKELAQDHSSVNDSIAELLDYLGLQEEFVPDAVILLQPTSPLRTTKHIDEALKLLSDEKSDYVISISAPIENPYDMVQLNQNGGIEFLMKSTVPGITQRQEHQPAYFVNGAIYACKTAAFLKSKSIFSEKMTPYFMKGSESIDVDTLDQLKIAAALLRAP